VPSKTVVSGSRDSSRLQPRVASGRSGATHRSRGIHATRRVSIVDARPVSPVPGERLCAWCHRALDRRKRQDTKFCSKACRQASWRFGVGRSEIQVTCRPMVFAYADPPYPGKAHYYPEQTEVDHVSLLETLQKTYPDGWALSTSSAALRDILPLCPPGVRVCAWFKGPRPTKSRRALMSWEPVIVCGGRPLPVTVVCDVADGLIARGRFRAFPGAMVGMKPPVFAEWLFKILGAAPGDRFDDLFPGSGAISLAWRRYAGVASAGEIRERHLSAEGDKFNRQVFA